jgi:uncharacterized protein YciW
MSSSDVIGALAGLDAESSARIRGHRPEVVRAAEQSLQSLFDIPDHDEAPGAGRVLRLLAAARAAHVDGAPEVAEYYAEQLGEEPDDALVGVQLALELVRDGADGPAGARASRRIRSLLRHIDLLVQRPAAATSDDLAALQASGWAVTEIVVLAQVVTFVSYQTRAVHGLRVLQEAAR